jgi:hypothetical protein
MSLEDKIKALLEGKTDDAVSEEELVAGKDEEITEDEIVEEEAIVEHDEAAQNAKINAGKGRKLEVDKVTGEASTDEPNNKRNRKGTDLQKGAEKNPVGEHVEALMAGEDLSEEFKTKAGAILEAAIADGVAKEIARLDEEYAVQLDEAVEAVRDELVEEIDGYLNEMVEAWMQENQLALERGVKADIVENFVNGLKDLFKENYIEVPEEKYNVLDEQANKIDELTSLLDESVATIETLTTEVKALSKKSVMESVGAPLTDTDYEKFASLCEGVEFTSAEEFEVKAKTIKENYFPKNKRGSVIAEGDEPAAPEQLVEGAMSHYVAALTNPLSFKRS